MDRSEAVRRDSGSDADVTLDGDLDSVGVTDRDRPESEAARTGRGEVAHVIAAGETFGRYEVLHHLGSGGMGVVYAAYDPQLDRKIAIKLLHGWHWGGNASDGAQQRLLREARAMAKLSAPNVVTVHDIGTIDGSLYIAMEFIDGVPLSTWQRRHWGDWRRIVDVYIEAARGLEAAHAAGFVHRDFKPDNVMIGNDGRVVVMDFGLVRPAVDAGDHEHITAARPIRIRPVAAASNPHTDESGGPLDTLETQESLDTQDTVDTRDSTGSFGDGDDRLTRAGAIMGTPAYMSLEQHTGAPADARSDQFSFCASLYESLYGERPFVGDSMLAITFAIMEGKIRPVPADSPCPGWLRRVVTRGLSSEPNDRFPDMAAVRQALAADPQERRRKAVIGGVAVVAFALVAARAYSAPSVTPPDPCGGAQALADEVWNPTAAAQIGERFRATQLPYAEHSVGVVTQVLDDYAQAWSAAHTSACMDANVHKTHSVELLDHRMACLDRRRGELRAAVEILRDADGATLEAADAVLHTLGPLEDCADLDAVARAVPPPSDPDQRARVEADRALLAEATALQAAHHLDAAEVRLAQVRDDHPALGYAPLRAEFALRDAGLAQARGDHARARTAFEQTVVDARSSGHDALASLAMTELVFLLAGPQADLRGARVWAALARADLHRSQGEGSVSEALLLDAEANLADAQGDHAAAHTSWTRALEIYARHQGDEGPDVAAMLNNLGTLSFAVGDLDASATAFDRAATLLEARWGEQHPAVGRARSNLGLVARREGRLAEARDHYQRALQIKAATGGDTDLSYAQTLDGLGLTELADGQFEAARLAFERSLAIYEALLDPADARRLDARTNLLEVANAEGDATRARALAEAGLASLSAELRAAPPTLDDAFALANLLEQAAIAAADDPSTAARWTAEASRLRERDR